MNKIKSPDDLQQRKQQVAAGLGLREKGNDPETQVQITVAMATCGIAAGARETMNVFLAEIEREQLPAIVLQTGCMGHCTAEPVVSVRRPGSEAVVFGHVDAARAKEIVTKYVKSGELPEGVLPASQTK